MLLNIFFENMNSQLELFLIGVFFFAIYWFILRKYNSLGLRLFVLCFCMFVAICVWVFKDELQLKNIITNGEEQMATVVSKDKTGKNDNEVELSFARKNGEIVSSKTSTYVSEMEWESFRTGKQIPVIYTPNTEQTFVKESLLRFKGDKIYLYYFAGFWLVLGSVLYFFLRKLKVGVDEETGDEYVIKEDGSIILDERKSQASRVMKRVNILSKMAQAFGR